MECQLERIVPLGHVGDHLVIGRIVRFHIRDDLWLNGGRIDTAALLPVGRLAAKYTLVDTVFACPIDPNVLNAHAGTRMQRLDARQSHWSPLDEAGWSAAGNAKLD